VTPTRRATARPRRSSSGSGRARASLQYIDPPGYLPPEARAKILWSKAQGRRPSQPLGSSPHPTVADVVSIPVEKLTKGGFVMAGNPDTVIHQLRDFFDAVGGFGSLLPMVQYWTMSTDLTVKSMERFARDVLPRFLEEVYLPTLRGDREIRAVAA
jgi:alkanesulfonate monooxygenase SsuD/methylene tetrahydromethanopterin reductase-like flavin-dependent oxidoreductase (luciferase family)